MLNEYVAVLIAAVPGIEAMWSSVYLICAHAEYLIPLAILINFIAVVAFVFVTEKYGMPSRIESFLERRVNSRIKQFEKWFSVHGYIIIFALIALPLTGVGSYTGAFIGRVLKLKKSIFCILF